MFIAYIAHWYWYWNSNLSCPAQFVKMFYPLKKIAYPYIFKET